MTYGCHNRDEYKKTLTVQNGFMRHSYNFGRSFEVPNKVEVPFRMTKECQYTKTDLGHKDEKCIGCRWRMTIMSELSEKKNEAHT